VERQHPIRPTARQRVRIPGTGPAWRGLLTAGAIVALGLTACTTDGDTTDGGPPGATPTAAAGVCPVGNWTSTQVAAGGSAGGVTVNAQGGGGVAVTIADGGAVKADFANMQPITYTAQVAGNQIEGEFEYEGTIEGTVTLGSGGAVTPTASPASTMSPATTATPGAATPAGTATPGASGSWQPTGQANVGNLGITIRVTRPISATVVDNVKVSEVTGAQRTQAGDAVDLQPLLRTGQYRCDGNDSLTITPSESGPTVTWTLQRA
jgi:hypothetical protein